MAYLTANIDNLQSKVTLLNKEWNEYKQQLLGSSLPEEPDDVFPIVSPVVISAKLAPIIELEKTIITKDEELFDFSVDMLEMKNLLTRNSDKKMETKTIKSDTQFIKNEKLSPAFFDIIVQWWKDYLLISKNKTNEPLASALELFSSPKDVMDSLVQDDDFFASLTLLTSNAKSNDKIIGLIDDFVIIRDTYKTSDIGIVTQSFCRPVSKQSGSKLEELVGMSEVKKVFDQTFKNPRMFPKAYETSLPNILMYGPPGVGKTQIVKSLIATYPDFVLFSPSPGELKAKYEGETEKNISDLFKCARNHLETNPKTEMVVIFFDEFETLASSRKEGFGSNVIPTLLQEMEGIEKQKEKLSIIAATNLPWDIDSAIMRRFQSRVYVSVPKTHDDKITIIKNEFDKNFPTGAKYFADSLIPTSMKSLLNSENIRQVELNINLAPADLKKATQKYFDYSNVNSLKIAKDPNNSKQQFFKSKLSNDLFFAPLSFITVNETILQATTPTQEQKKDPAQSTYQLGFDFGTFNAIFSTLKSTTREEDFKKYENYYAKGTPDE